MSQEEHQILCTGLALSMIYMIMSAIDMRVHSILMTAIHAWL